MWDLAAHARKVDGELVTLNVSTDDVIACMKSPIIRSKTINNLKSYFPLTQKERTSIKHLNFRITQSQDHISMDQICRILKMTAAYFKNDKFVSTYTPFRTDRKVESEIANTTLGLPEQQSILKETYGYFYSNFGSALHTIFWTRIYVGHSMKRLGYF